MKLQLLSCICVCFSRLKTDSKGKPPPRPDAGYSLYSTDSEDQVATAFEEMQACEKILTHLKHKQKGECTQNRNIFCWF